MLMSFSSSELQTQLPVKQSTSFYQFITKLILFNLLLRIVNAPSAIILLQAGSFH